MMQKLLRFCLVCFVLLSPWPSQAYPIKYDIAFKQWGQFFFPFEDWKHWKAQGMAESGLNPGAISSCGALSIMQLMPSTARDLDVNPYNAESNIQGGIKYDRQLDKIWKKIASQDERRNFVYASYNAGPGWIIKASRLARSAKWEDVSSKLPMITGANAKQTQDYVKHINRFYVQIRNN